MSQKYKNVIRSLIVGWMATAIYLAIALAPQAPLAQPTPEPTIAVASNNTPCEHIYDGASGPSGKALYVFDHDVADTPPKCIDACANKWPPLLVTSSVNPVIVPPAVSTLGGSVTNGNNLQLSYGNHRVYTFNGDTTVSDTNGSCVKDEGGTFQLLKPDGTVCPCDVPAP